MLGVPECQTGAIKLSGGNDTYGIVELCVAGVWSTVCSSSWEMADAQVACRELGFSPQGW